MTPAPALKRRLGFGLLTLYGVGVMVGAGIYVLIGAVAGEVGEWSPLAFIIAGLVAAPTALSYAELSARIPESAGEAAYMRAATGRDMPGALIGLAVAAVGVVSAAAVLQGGVGYLRALVDLPPQLLAVAIGALIVGISIWGVLESLAFAAILTVIEIIGLVVVIFVGVAWPIEFDPAPIDPTFAGMGAAALLAFFAFVGFEDMVNMAEEVREPERTMPRAIIAALALTTFLYVLVAWAAIRAAPASTLAGSERPLALAFETATGRSAAFLALIAGVAALNGVLAQIVMSARVLFGLGRFWAPFHVFHQAHPRFGTPVAATLAAGAIVILLAIFAPIDQLAATTSIILLIVFIAINGALIALRRGGGPRGGFRTPIIVPVAGVVLSVGALIWALAV